MTSATLLPKISFLLKYMPQAASSRVRGIDLSLALEAMGVDSRVAHPAQRGYRARYLRLAARRGATVFQKRSSPNDHLVVQLRRRLGLASVFDLDDAPGGIPFDSAEEARAIRMMRDATLVTVGGHELYRFALQHNRNAVLVPSSVDTDVFEPRPRPARAALSIGWLGNARAHLEDILSVAGVLARIRQRRRVRMIVVGAVGMRQVHDAFDHPDDTVIDGIDWSDTSEIVRSIEGFDIGVYPLRPTAVNKYTCGYKAIQYMAMGIPVVASPAGENEHIVSPGETGFLVDSEAEWLDALISLIDDPDMRHRMGDAGRRRATGKYSTKVAAATLLEALRRSSAARR